MPGPPATSLPPIQLKDFTPGIADLPGANYPPTQASRANTYRCIAHPNGALQPLFGSSTSYPGVNFNSGTPNGGAYVVDGFFAAGPLIPTGMGITASSRPHELWLGVEYTTATQRVHKLERLLVDEDPVTRDVIKSVTVADTTMALNGWGMTFGSTRANQTTPNDPGIPVVIAAWSPPLTGVGSYILEFPNDTTPASDTPYLITDAGINDRQCLIICHQARIIIRRETIYGHGADQVWATTEDLFFTDPNDPSVVNGPQTFVPENPDGYSIMAAMSANELFALKQSGGLVIAGDIDFPTVLNLPMVAGAGDGGAYTRDGFMYGGTNGGLWLWSHGDSSKNLSPKMDPDFYLLGTEILVAQRYQWDAAGELTFLSNNFVYDSDTQALWRLEDPDVAELRFMAHRLQWLYGATSSYLPTALTCIYSWDMTTPATSYSWQSHPLWETLDRQVDIRQISLRASGEGTVTITLTDSVSGNTWSQNFIIGSPNPILQYEKGSLRGQAITIRIESSGSSEAPTIYELTLDPQERQRVGQVA